MTATIQRGYAEPTGDMPLTRAFLTPGAKIYKRGIHAINGLIMAGMVYSFLSYTQSSSPNFVPDVPDAPAASANLEPLPGMERIPRPPARPTINSDHLGEFSEIDVPGIDTYDADGVYSVSNSVSHTVRGAGHLIGPVTAEMFGIDKHHISDEVMSSIRSASAAESGKAPLFVMLGIGHIESGFDPVAKNPKSSATGVFQITTPTLRGLIMRQGKTMGYGDYVKYVGFADSKTYWRDQGVGDRLEDMRNVPKHSARWAARLHVDNANRITNQIGRSLEPAEYYVAHFMGASMAPIFLRNIVRKPSATLDRDTWGSQIDSNPTIFKNDDGSVRTYAQVMNWFEEKKEVSRIMAYYALAHMEPGSEGYQWGYEWSRENGVIDTLKHGPDPDVEAETLAARF